MMNQRGCAMISVGIMLASSLGCASFHKKSVPAKSAHHLVGTIALYNQELGFVLIDTSSFAAPALGTALKSIPLDGSEGAVFTVSAERKRPFIVADVVHGTPHPGDRVYE
jgi:hypothetical protein